MLPVQHILLGIILPRIKFSFSLLSCHALYFSPLLATMFASFLPFIAHTKAVSMATWFLIYKSVNSPDVRLHKRERACLSRKLKRSNEVSGFDMPFKKA